MENDYNESFIDELIDDVREGDFFVFLGSGFSINFGLSNWFNFIEDLLKNLLNCEYLTDNQKNNLEKINIVMRTNGIDLNFALNEIYQSIGVSKYQVEGADEYLYDDYEVINVVRKTYRDNFKKNNSYSSIDKILDFVSGVITTNYDNLLINKTYKKAIVLNKKDCDDSNKLINLLNKLFDNYDNKKIKENNQFLYIPIHGYVNSRNFNNQFLNPWSSKDEWPLIDSFDSFNKNYSKDSSIRKILKLIISILIKYDKKIIFFGYSFNDYQFANMLAKIIEEIRVANYSGTKFPIYIINDNFESYIINEIQNNVFDKYLIPSLIIDTKMIKQINFSDFVKFFKKNVIWNKKYSSFISQLNEIMNSARDFINNKLKLDLELNKNVISFFLKNNKVFLEFKTWFYASFFENLIRVLNKKITEANNFFNDPYSFLYNYFPKNKIYNNALNKIKHELMSIKNVDSYFLSKDKKEEIAMKILKNFQSQKEDFFIYYYLLVTQFSLNCNDNTYEIFKSLFSMINIDELKRININSYFKKFVLTCCLADSENTYAKEQIFYFLSKNELAMKWVYE